MKKSAWKQQLKKLLPENEFLMDDAALETHSGDKWFAASLPEVVVVARSTETVSRTLKFAHANGIPVTPRGAGHGYVGGCVPLNGGISLSVSRMKKIKQVHERDFVAVVEPGVITAKLQERVEKKGLYYPPDPASRKDCSIGGNIATNAGGPKCLKYGVTRDYVMGLEVVLHDGTVVQLGGRNHKNKTGFDLHRIFVGSEGMLGMVTEATLKLLPLPPFASSLSVGFATMKEAVKALRTVFSSGFLPCALEVADEFTLAAARKRTDTKMFDGCKAHVIVELDGREKSVRTDIKDLRQILNELKPVFLNTAHGKAACEKIWDIRREFSYSLRDTGLTKLNEDIVVPRGRLEDLFRFTSKLQKNHGIPIACFGHAGDGNIHVNVMVDKDDPVKVAAQDEVLDKLFGQVVEWGGAITGEHGVGIAKSPWWNIATTKESRALHHVIKDALDPKGILNPGKFLG
ncbi:FAD-binding protein [bacterium]|nr:FAD-binding protein [bacterium]